MQNQHDAPLQCNVQSQHDDPLQCNVQNQHDDPLQCNVQIHHVDSRQWNVQSQHVIPTAVPRVVRVRTGLIGDHSGHLRSDWLKLGVCACVRECVESKSQNTFSILSNFIKRTKPSEYTAIGIN